MKKLLLALLMAATMGVTTSAGVQLSVDNPDYNFDKVLEGTIVIHTFILTNPGTVPVQITKVRASCGCTATALSDYALAPGKFVELEARVDTSGFGGEIVKSIYVDYGTADGSEHATVTLHIAGKVLRAQEYHITVGELNYLFYILIDLREPDAYAAGHLMGALNIPYAEFAAWVERLPTGVIIVLYDQTGAQSDEIAQTLWAQGYSDARSLQGGLDGWSVAYDNLFIQGSGDSESRTLDAVATVAPPEPYHIMVSDLNYLFYILIDLREPDAYAAGHLMGALNIPHAEFAAWVERLPTGVIIVLYDQTGTLSDEAVQVLITAGFNDARSLLGGLDAWNLAYEDQFVLKP